MSEGIEKIVMGTCDLPAIPAVASKVLKILPDSSTTASQLQKVISADQALTARVLKIANSAFYGRVRDIQTISEAIVVVGFNTLKSIVLTVSSREIYKRFGLTEKMLWEHSIGAAVCAAIIAREIGFENEEEAFLGGLFHDVGKVVLNNSDPQKFSSVMEKVYNEHLSFRVAEWDIFGFSHTEVGSLVIRKWKLSEALELVIKNQYNPRWLSTTPYLMRLTAIVSLANQFCLNLGLGHREAVPGLKLEEEEGFVILGMDPKRLPSLLRQSKTAYEEQLSLFD